MSEQKNKEEEGLWHDPEKELTPVSLDSEIEELCEKIDEFYTGYSKKPKNQDPSDLIRGAYYAMRPECKSNPDWMSQAANSAREAIYPLWSNEPEHNLLYLFKKYSIEVEIDIQNEEFTNKMKRLDQIYRELQDITHHGTDPNSSRFEKDNPDLHQFTAEDFEDLMNEFSSTLRTVLSLQQIFIHNLVDSIIDSESKDKEDLDLILETNYDAREYFYNHVTPEWFDWLWHNGFLDIVKKNENFIESRYQSPELSYIARISESEPQKITNLVLLEEQTATTKDKFNPEVVGQFLNICAKLPADELVEVIPKIKEQDWPRLMSQFGSRGFEYKEMFSTLGGSGEDDATIELADALLQVRTKEEIENDESSSFRGGPFYFQNLSYTEIFHHLVEIPDENIYIVELGEPQQDGYFQTRDMFPLLDTDFFTTQLNEDYSRSAREDVDQLFAVYTELIRRGFDSCEDENEVEEIYKRYVEPMPLTRVMWRFRLFALSQCSEVFQEELKDSFYEIFDEGGLVEYYSELLSGAEYLKALRKGFSIIDQENKLEYINSVITQFHQRHEAEEEQDWHLEYGSRILSMLKKIGELPDEKEQEAIEKGFDIREDITPRKQVSMEGPTQVISQGSITEEEFNNISIEEITNRMEDEWTPESLNEDNTNEDFHFRRGAKGLGKLLKDDIPKRFEKYIENAMLFFDEESIDAHYTREFARGILEVLQNEPADLSDTNWEKLISFCKTVVDSVGNKEKEERETEQFGTFLADWVSVSRAVSDVIRVLVDERNDHINVDFTEHRDDLLDIIEKLLANPDPGPEDDELETTSMKQKLPDTDEYFISDPHTRAINSVRGRTFQTFVLFVYRDGEELQDDVKDIYEELLEKENTQPLMFLFGYHIAPFYFGKKEWLKDQLDKIFSEDNHDLYLAAWEGYVANKIYKEIFFEPEFQGLYKAAVGLDSDSYTKRKYFRELDKGLAMHIALALILFEEFDCEHSLFEKFWQEGREDHIVEFISFIGRRYVSGDNAAEERAVEMMGKIWEKALEEKGGDNEVLMQFGYWIDTEKGVFDIETIANRTKETLDKTNGAIEWDHGLQESIVDLAEEAPNQTLDILYSFFVNGVVELDNPSRHTMPLRENWIKAFEILYENEETKGETYELINTLIEKGGRLFWDLEDIVDE
jgi:hypothetical protein